MSQLEEVTYQTEEISEKLSGGTIENPIFDDTPGEEGFGFKVTRPNGQKWNVWVSQDAEGNGPGWLHVEAQS